MFETYYHKIEALFGNLKTAVFLIIAFSICMMVGTFLESSFSAEFAARILYKTWPFILLQACMLLSIIFATFIRLPPKKRLYGFYMIHAGLVTIGAGSFVTFYAGVDGNITLEPSSPNRYVVLSSDILEVQNTTTGNRFSYYLPNNALAKDLNISHPEFKIRNYLPYSKKTTQWKQVLISDEAKTQDNSSSSDLDDSSLGNSYSGTYFLTNSRISQEFTLSLNPKSDYKNQINLGPLNINLLPTHTLSCFSNPAKILVYNSEQKKCNSLNELKIELKSLSSGTDFFVYKFQGKEFRFFPKVSPWPFDSNFKPITNSALRLINKTPFEQKKFLFILGENITYFDAEEWIIEKVGSEAVALPWMGFEFSILKSDKTKYPLELPVYEYPANATGELIRGKGRHIQVQFGDNRYWIGNEKYTHAQENGSLYKMVLRKRLLELPFELTLDKFKMDTDPGTNNPASYESYVKLFSGEASSSHHVYMNNPLKYKGLTFYQASYGQDPKTGAYFSTLSVNLDPGRWLKYLGSIMLVFGSIWHFLLRRRKA